MTASPASPAAKDPHEPVIIVSGRMMVAITDLLESLVGLTESVREGLTPASVARAFGDEAVRQGVGVLSAVAGMASGVIPGRGEAKKSAAGPG